MGNWRSLFVATAIFAFGIALNAPSSAQDGQEVIQPFIGLMNTMIEQGMRQQAIDRYRNSPEFRDQEIQPGGLTRGQVIIVQQLLVQRGYDVGAPDGVIGPKTRAVVGQLQAKAGTAVTGYPTPDLLNALLQSN